MPFFKPKLKKNGMYVIESGELQGGFFVWIQKYDKPGFYAFLFMPHPMEAVFVRKDEIREMLSKNQLSLVEALPDNVYAVCQANFVYYANAQKLPIDGTKHN